MRRSKPRTALEILQQLLSLPPLFFLFPPLGIARGICTTAGPRKLSVSIGGDAIEGRQDGFTMPALIRKRDQGRRIRNYCRLIHLFCNHFLA